MASYETTIPARDLIDLTPMRRVRDKWLPTVRIRRGDGMVWRRWVQFHGRRRWFVGLNAQLWNIRHG